ncbi:potassium-transporting ATPase subunit KdpA [Fodinibius sp. SL11]|uniref:potassium-transporting ATPase subunit KdpA n=1 Tax=Fodinibius sp. SL11 TaxID=3425690 RepID=UPI003F882129
MARVYRGEHTILDPALNPLEKLFYKISRISPDREMNWKQHLGVLLTINMMWFVWGMVLLVTQKGWFWNPAEIPNMSPDLAFNTVISFVVNCNLQHYSGETGLTYWSQLGFITFMQFVSAGTGMAACAVIFRAIKTKQSEKLGNFYRLFVRSCVHILLPLAIVVGSLLALNGSPVTWEGYDTITTLEGHQQTVAKGPAAAEIAIKQLGTNGGGFFGANSSVPFENPNYFTNIIETMAILLIPMAMVFAFGYYTEKKKLAWIFFAVMTVGYLALTTPAVYGEMGGNPAIAQMGVSQELGSMEGTETRFGPAASALWATATTSTSNGSVNSMHDSLMPLGGMATLTGMFINANYGGVGVGFINFYVFVIVAIFIAGLMVGRTPEFLGKKVEAKEMKIATIVVLLHPAVILIGTAISAWLITHNPDWAWLNNAGFHGHSEMLYEFSSATANNGSGFEGLGDNTPWWNIATGVALLLGRYVPIIGPIAIAGLLANKQFIPETAGTLKADTATFGVVLFAVIVVIAALAFLPALVLGPIGEYFMLY